jgi:hypothetical protein
MASKETIDRLRKACQTTDPKWAKTWRTVSEIYDLHHREGPMRPSNGDQELTALFDAVDKAIQKSLDELAIRLRIMEQAEEKDRANRKPDDNA